MLFSSSRLKVYFTNAMARAEFHFVSLENGFTNPAHARHWNSEKHVPPLLGFERGCSEAPVVLLPQWVVIKFANQYINTLSVLCFGVVVQARHPIGELVAHFFKWSYLKVELVGPDGVLFHSVF